MLPILYETSQAIPDEIANAVISKIKSYQVSINRSWPWWWPGRWCSKKCRDLRQTVSEYRGVLKTRAANRITISFIAVGIVMQNDEPFDFWNEYYFQLDDNHILFINGGMFNDKVHSQVWPNSKIEIYWRQNSNGIKEILGVITTGIRLPLSFELESEECQWLYPLPSRIFVGNLQKLIQSKEHLILDKPAIAELEQAKALLEVLHYYG